MQLSFIVIFSLLACVCQVLGQSDTDQNPLPLVYTLYPFYNSETLLEVWKGDRTIDISANLVTLPPREQEQPPLFSDDVQRNASTNSKSQDNLSYFLNDEKNGNEEQLLNARQHISTYRNRHKDTSLQNE